MTLTNLTGKIKFRVESQKALSRWQATAIRDALARNDSPPEELRFQCRMATDARQNFAHLDLSNGETLKLHHRSRPQFGKNRDGDAYLTVTMTYSGDGQSYCLRWTGDGVPRKMQELAVKHDEGRAVKACVILIDLADAEVKPSWTNYGQTVPPSERDYKGEIAKASERKAAGKPVLTRAKRSCARLTAADLQDISS